MLKPIATFVVGSLYAVSALAAAAQTPQQPQTTTLLAQPAQAQASNAPGTSVSTAPPMVGGWDYNAGGIVAHTWTLHLDLHNGSFAPQLGFAYAFGHAIEAGLQLAIADPVSFSGGTPAPSIGSSPMVLGELPIRLSLLNDGHHSFGIKLTPGLGIGRTGSGLVGTCTLLIGVRLSYGYWLIAKTLQLGGAIEVPMAIIMAPFTYFRAPLQAGLHMEYNFIEHFALYGEARFGPMFDTFNALAWNQSLFFGLAAHL